MRISANDAFPANMAISGLFTHSEFQAKGLVHSIMDAAERFVFNDKGAELILLFCPDSLREFYAERGWRVLTEPIMLKQSDDWTTWSETTMGLFQTYLKIDDSSVRVNA